MYLAKFENLHFTKNAQNYSANISTTVLLPEAVLYAKWTEGYPISPLIKIINVQKVHLWPLRLFCTKDFWTIRILGTKYFLDQLFVVKDIFFCDQQCFGTNNNLGQKDFVDKKILWTKIYFSTTFMVIFGNYKNNYYTATTAHKSMCFDTKLTQSCSCSDMRRTKSTPTL